MPIYEYVCLDCGERFEKLRLMREADMPIACSSCDSEHTTRKVSVVFAHSGGKMGAESSRSTINSGGGCAGCSGGSCSTCGH
jgi:putative FmdB family regulatory protein